MAPGDPTAGVLSPTVAKEVREAYRERLGLNQPIWVQYGVYLKNLPVGTSVRRSLPASRSRICSATTDAIVSCSDWPPRS